MPSVSFLREDVRVAAGQVRWERLGPVRWSVGSDNAIVVVEGRLEPSHVGAVCASLHLVLSGSGVGSLTCRGEGLVDPDLATVDLLARLRLAAQLAGWDMRVEEPSSRLRELLVLTGLDDLLASRGSSIEAWGQAEHREQPSGVEEGVESDDRST